MGEGIERTEIEEKAIGMGWIPPDEFKGDPDRHMSAEIYVERGETLLPIVKKRLEKFENENKDLLGKVQASDAKLKKLEDTLNRVVKTSATISARAREDALETIRKEQYQAAQDNDTDKFNKLEEKKEKLIQSDDQSNAETDTTVQKSQVVSDWEEKNKDWYNQNNLAMVTYAESMDNFICKTRPDIVNDAGAVLAEVEKLVKEKFPDKFINNNRNTDAPVEDNISTTGIQNKNTKSKTYENLPKEAQEQCKILMDKIKGYTKKQYCADYDWD